MPCPVLPRPEHIQCYPHTLQCKTADLLRSGINSQHQALHWLSFMQDAVGLTPQPQPLINGDLDWGPWQRRVSALLPNLHRRCYAVQRRVCDLQCDWKRIYQALNARNKINRVGVFTSEVKIASSHGLPWVHAVMITDSVGAKLQQRGQCLLAACSTHQPSPTSTTPIDFTFRHRANNLIRCFCCGITESLYHSITEPRTPSHPDPLITIPPFHPFPFHLN